MYTDWEGRKKAIWDDMIIYVESLKEYIKTLLK